ncbi:MAG: restriction endonuclease [Kofleriaceae bacterium]
MTKTTPGDGDSEGATRKKPSRSKAPAKSGKKPSGDKRPAAKKTARPKKPRSEKADKSEKPPKLEAVVEAAPVVEDPAVEPIEDAEILSVVEVESAGAPEADEEPTLTVEEQELSAIYGDEAGSPASAHTEYSDSKTADEDRPMLPEINARDERRAQWQDRRERRRQRREERDRQRQDRRDQARTNQPQHPAHAGGDQRHGDQPRHGARDRAATIPIPRLEGRPIQPPVHMNGEEVDGSARVGTPLGDAASTLFAQLRNGQPLPVRQLAAMMRKRSLVETDPEQLAPQLKAELLGDERSYRTLGLRPRIVYRGRDLFAPGPVAMSVTADAEAGVAAALSRLANATHRALAQRIARATPAGFERLIHAYLVAAGYKDITWIKRLEGISYASATAPGIDRTILISARSGDQPIDRRGIGELRVGVEAKNLVAGILFSARELSEDAERELERAGRSIAVICGDQLVAALIASGVGVVSSAAPLHYVDDQLLDELLAG